MGVSHREKLLQMLEQIEVSVGDIYETFSMQDDFSETAREFWAAMAEAERNHAELFRTIRRRANLDSQLDLAVHTDPKRLQAILNKVRSVALKIRAEPVSESRAYLLGAGMEETLSEFSHTKRVKTSAADIQTAIHQVEEDTKHHYISLHNLALAHSGPPKSSKR